MMRREVFEAAGGYRDAGWPEDYDLWMRLALAGQRFDKLPDVLLEWRDAPGRASRVDEVYSAARFRALKRHYLVEHVLVPGRPLAIWGAGPIGKEWARALGPSHLVELDPRKVGQTIHGASVIAADEVRKLRDSFIVVAVGALSRRRSEREPYLAARDEIRERLVAHGFVELDDFICVA